MQLLVSGRGALPYAERLPRDFSFESAPVSVPLIVNCGRSSYEVCLMRHS